MKSSWLSLLSKVNLSITKNDWVLQPWIATCLGESISELKTVSSPDVEHTMLLKQKKNGIGSPKVVHFLSNLNILTQEPWAV